MLPDSAFRFRVDGVTFTGEPFLHVPGVYVRDVEGLSAGGDVAPQSIALDGGDGEFDLPNRRTDPRVIVLSGFVYADSMVELGVLLRRLDGLLAGPDARGLASWHEYGEWFRTVVRRGRGASTVRRGSTGFAEYTIRFRAPSQRYFGQQHESAAATTHTLVNRGNFPAEPVVTVPGPHPGFTITGPAGRVFQVTQPAAAGHAHTVDLRTGMVALDGVPQPGVTGAAAVWSVPAYGEVAASVTVPATLRWSDTYV